ncbi:MAG TPA: hypothetical protein VJS37_09710 [Terriglobales bacterium]|nr:hypothetical protein [Terriglobales bacterium]
MPELGTVIGKTPSLGGQDGKVLQWVTMTHIDVNLMLTSDTPNSMDFRDGHL